MSRRIIRKSGSGTARAQALRDLKTMRARLKSQYPELMARLERSVAVLQGSLPAGAGEVSIDQRKSRETVLKFLEMTDSEFLKKEIRKALT